LHWITARFAPPLGEMLNALGKAAFRAGKTDFCEQQINVTQRIMTGG
jgi:hypothetical protein